MGIIVLNVSESKGIPHGYGEQHYLVRINSKRIAEFTHNFEDGLALCLRKAADAVEDPGRLEIVDDLSMMLVEAALGMFNKNE